ncbi:MAG: DUF4279 domain-containing protein [Bacteroidetes bacterium]|nr:DUF4279 domain-containing protein [Bacteroidota bacterium]
MTDDKIKDLILKEFQEKTLGVTEQYLDIHEPIYENGFPKIARIARKDDYTIVYLPVKGEHFLFEVYINEPAEEIYSIATLPRNTISFIAISDELSAEELSMRTKLKITRYWNKGDYRFENKIAVHKSNAILIEPDITPGEFEDKLKSLLYYLLQDKDGIKALAEKSDVYIDVVSDYHYGNQHVGTTFIDTESISMMNDLNLSIQMDIWAWGNPFK